MARRGRETFRSLRIIFTAAERALGMLPRGFSRRMLRTARGSNSAVARAGRYLALRRIAKTCGELVDVRGNCYLLAEDQLSLGSRISIHPFCYIDATGGLEIGDDVSIAHGVSILTTDHRFSDPDIPIRDQGVELKPTKVGSNVWIGAGARILAGTTIGIGSIVAAGAVVTSDVLPNSVVAGIPARAIKSR